MKKRYLAMLMAVVMCLSFGITGAMAAEEPAVETAEVSTESAAPASEQLVESAAPSETPTAVETAANVPTPVSLSDNTVPLDSSDERNAGRGVAIAGYGGQVVYSYVYSSPDQSVEWKTSEPTGVTVSIRMTPNPTTSAVICAVDSTTAAGAYPFEVKNVGGSSHLDDCTLNVLTLDQAKEKSAVSYVDFTLVLNGTASTAASPTPLQGATFGLYASETDAADPSATPLATFETDADGKATISASELSASDLPTISSNQTYYLKQLTTANGWACASDPIEVTGTAAWTEDDSNFGATIGLVFTLSAEGQGNDNPIFVSNIPMTYAYEGFDLYAWAMKDVTWDENTLSYEYDRQMLSGIEFSLYVMEQGTSGEETKVTLARFTTDENGKAKIDASDIPVTYRPTPDSDGEKTYYLCQETGYEANGRTSPVGDEYWFVTATAALSADGKTFTIKLEAPQPEQGDEWAEVVKEGAQNGLWVRSERYTSMSFDITKTVTVKNEGIQTGENTFNFLVAMDTFGDVQVSFTPDGGEETTPTYTQETNSTVRLYALPLTVSGEGTAKGTVTISGWESELMQCYIEVYELGDAPADWEYADDMYLVTRPGYDYTDESGEPGGWKELLYDGMKMALGHWAQIAAPAGGENTLPGESFELGGNEYVYRGYDGKWYDSVLDEPDGVVFVNTYTKALPAAATTKNSPKTGDEAVPMLWLALASVSMMGVALVARKKVK